MNREKVIEGLKNLKAHCESMHCEEGDQWEDDVTVLSEAISLIKLQESKLEFEGQRMTEDILDKAIRQYDEKLQHTRVEDEEAICYYSQMLVWLEELRELRAFKKRVMQAVNKI